MRIISGKYKGRTLEGYHMEGTRPTMDRVKESLFAMIGQNIKDSICLDLFAGSGALGLEALSNGAEKVYFVDYEKEAIRTCQKNLEALKVTENYEVLNVDFKKALEDFKNKNIQFDIIFLDPPYHRHYIHKILPLLVSYNLLKENGQVVCEYEEENIITDCLTLYKEKKYGTKWVRIYIK